MRWLGKVRWGLFRLYYIECKDSEENLGWVRNTLLLRIDRMSSSERERERFVLGVLNLTIIKQVKY